MGYFSNSDEGLEYEARYCHNCVHFKDGEDGMCPVMELHILSASQSDQHYLDMFIPREGADNQECVMYITAPGGAPWDP